LQTGKRRQQITDTTKKVLKGRRQGERIKTGDKIKRNSSGGENT
jgi:hypothetical protein